MATCDGDCRLCLDAEDGICTRKCYPNRYGERVMQPETTEE